MNAGKRKIMSEVFQKKKKKKKKRHHSGSSNDFEAPNKRIKLEATDTADDSVILSPPPGGLNCDTSVVEGRRKKKHKRHHAAGVDVNIIEHGSVELNRTGTDCNASDISVEQQSYVSGLKKSNSHKRPKDVKQQDSPRQEQTVACSSLTVNRMCPPELR